MFLLAMKVYLHYFIRQQGLYSQNILAYHYDFS